MAHMNLLVLVSVSYLRFILHTRKCWISFSPAAAVAAAKSLQSCPTLCDPTDGSPPGSPVPGILQARTLEWGAISFFSAWKWKVKVKSLSCVRPLATPWTAAHQAPPSLGLARQEHWSGLPSPSPICPRIDIFSCLGVQLCLKLSSPVLGSSVSSTSCGTYIAISEYFMKRKVVGDLAAFEYMIEK